MSQAKPEVISFKADRALSQALAQVPNRSAFIRAAVEAALEGLCPLCRGTGTLSPDQRRHWEEFSSNHHLERCGECHALHLVCGGDPQGSGSCQD